MRAVARSTCPISLTLEVIGDRWSLLILRDLMFANKRHYREFLASEERISSQILHARLQALVEAGLVERIERPGRRRSSEYALTERGISLLPVVAQIGIWGATHCETTPESSATARELERRGPAHWRTLMERLGGGGP